MERLRYFTGAAKRGWRVLRHPAENLGLALGVLAVFGLPTTVGVVRGSGVAGLLAGLALSLIGVTLEGAFQLWRGVDHRDRIVDAFYASFATWYGEVERFLESREAARAPIPNGHLRLRLAQIQVKGKATVEPIDTKISEATAAAEAHDRETVSIYIDKYRDRGLALYDALVKMGVLKEDDTKREQVRAPKSKFAITDAKATIWLGAESDLRRYL
jgi:hypothetical protein